MNSDQGSGRGRIKLAEERKRNEIETICLGIITTLHNVTGLTMKEIAILAYCRLLQTQYKLLRVEVDLIIVCN